MSTFTQNIRTLGIFLDKLGNPKMKKIFIHLLKVFVNKIFHFIKMKKISANLVVKSWEQKII